MKRIIGLLLGIAFVITGCNGADDTMEHAMRLRSQLQSNVCSFESVITADYGDVIYTFSLECQTDQQGSLTFRVKSPESIAGISGVIESGGGKLTFDDVALSFAMLADGQLTPVSGPWVFVSALRGGYIAATGQDGDYTRLTIHDSYAEDALTVDIWITADGIPVQAEIEWDNRRILTMEIKNFTLG